MMDFIKMEILKQKRNKFANEYGLSVIEKLVKKVKWTVTADKVVLHDDWSPCGVKQFLNTFFHQMNYLQNQC